MVLTFDFENLVQNLTDISEVVDDGLLSENARNVIMRLTSDGVELIGVNQLITFTRPVDHEYYTLSLEEDDLVDGVKYIQVKSKELLGFLNSYKGLRKTEVESVTFEEKQGGRILCIIVEKDTIIQERLQKVLGYLEIYL